MSSFVYHHYPATLKHPPGPKGHWLWGTMRELGDEPLGSLLKWTRRYGDALRFRYLAAAYGYFFCHPDHVQHILQENYKNYTKMPAPGNMVLRPLVGNGLLTSDGDFWLRQRRLAQPSFHRRRIAGFAKTMTDAAAAMTVRWQAPADTGETLDLAREMMELTLEIAGKTLFSRDLTGESREIGRAFSEVSRHLIHWNAIPFGPYLVNLPWFPGIQSLYRGVGVLDRVVHRIIEEKREERRRGMAVQTDLLDLLMDARDSDGSTGMSDEQLRDEVMTIMLAGHETTALALAWTFFLLSENPAVRRRLEGEVDQTLNGRTPGMDDLPDLKYATMVVEEAMRLYPPAYATSRYCREADVIGGFDIPAGSVVVISPYVTHRHPDFWPRPEQFDPQRFTVEQKADRPRFAYIPFGGGPRQCIGNRFAMTEAVLILAMVCQQYRLDLVPGHPVALDPLITLRPKHGLQVRVQRRNR